MLNHHLNQHPLPTCGFLGLPEGGSWYSPSAATYHEETEVMLSFAQHTEGSHNVMFYLLQQLNLPAQGREEKQSKVRGGDTPGPMIDGFKPSFLT